MILLGKEIPAAPGCIVGTGHAVQAGYRPFILVLPGMVKE